jgi:AbrB family looped-hinge helix DNA binding protein
MVEVKEGKHIFGIVKVGARGQIVIPKEAREMFGIKAGDSLLVAGDKEKGIAIVKADLMKNLALKILEGLGYVTEKVGIKKKGENG